ncbi:ubiquitin carboxyl-terminal hydrolase, family 1 [Amniculicola lignicola CBS 123094]|uniref:Ubiquitin carboxyl-terminal hydrolase n=1 Tax=Amniculicola lignicola CBS 123094 TaxID=1392246 RepID=A0A6A5WMB8_9PLEO|nr:ubiquitin carboxyl-terminal hydrolase, family 1 [Amniculicola lignicola CBS 123094]
MYRKHFIPLESNPDVFTELIHSLGVSESLCFEDVLSLDDPELLAFLPRPAYGLVLVFPTTESYEKRTEEEDAKLEEYVSSGADEDVVFFKQTIYNACGLYALLHATCNGPARDFVEKESTLAGLIETGLSLEPEERALVLEKSEKLESAYASVAAKGDTAAPEDPEDEVDFHYICFVKSHKNGQLYLLDGDRKRPISLGPLEKDEDVLSKKCLDVIRTMMDSGGGENINFSLMALVPADS